MTQGDTAVEASQGTPKIVDETGKRTESAVGAGTLRIDHPMLALSDVATRQGAHIPRVRLGHAQGLIPLAPDAEVTIVRMGGSE